MQQRVFLNIQGNIKLINCHIELKEMFPYDVDAKFDLMQLLLTAYISFFSLKHFKEFAEAIKVVKDKGVVVVVASLDDVAKANKEKDNFFEVKKVL